MSKGHKKCFLFLSILVCLGWAPVARGYHHRNADRDRYDDSADAEADEVRHSFRHQQHYSRRIEQAVSEFKHKKNLTILTSTAPPPLGVMLSAQEFGPHHLRHHNRHHEAWEKRVFPALRHQPTTTTTADPPTTRRSTAKSFAFVGHGHGQAHGYGYNRRNQTKRFYDREGYNSMSGMSSAPYLLHRQNKIDNKHKNQNHKGSSGHDRSFSDDNRFSAEYDDDDDSDGYEDDADEEVQDEPRKRSMSTTHRSRQSLSQSKSSLDEGEDNSDDYDDDEDDYDYGSSSSATSSSSEDKGSSSNRKDASSLDDNLFDYYNGNSNKLAATTANRRRSISKNDDSENILASRDYVPGKLSQRKFEELGTRKAVRTSFEANHYKKTHSKFADEHMKKMSRATRCQNPVPKVVRIQTDPSKSYFPHCTVLHRCGDDTGCCGSETKTCAAKQTHSVHLYFHVYSIMNGQRNSVERLTFENHTACHCIDIGRSRQSTELNVAPSLMKRATVMDCTCPHLFDKILQDDGKCRCDCTSGNGDCVRLKRGLEHFPISERMCIKNGRCQLPTCEHGEYVKPDGRCPRQTVRIPF